MNDYRIDSYDYKNKQSVFFKLNWLMNILMFIRLYILLRTTFNQSTYMTTRAQRLCLMYGCNNGYQYAFKCLFSDIPIYFVMAQFLISLPLLACCLLMCESPINYNLGQTNPMDFTKIFNNMWCIFITMTTTGYGDFFPRTNYGRILDTVIAIWGSFIFSLIVRVLSSLINLESSEQKAHIIL